ncbi:NAD/NADP-dependent indole-3-acetaldehyde reductase [Leucoagaricus sp. SymC.cos]|nr:NAD/NADP-dependent indole-3-acetaldehyde reductase [Leucoagaricus sp. SymC.cos]
MTSCIGSSHNPTANGARELCREDGRGPTITNIFFAVDHHALGARNKIPSIAFGTWTLGNGQSPIDQVEQAISVGFSHVDTAQSYRNEEEAGKAIRESGLARGDIFITTKYSGLNGLDIETSIENSLKNLGVSYVDLYLIHHPRLAVPDIPTAWRKFEELKERGLAKSIGVSNFGVPELKTLLASAKIKPAANQILLHPYVYARQAPILSFAASEGIAIEAYSTLIPLTRRTGGPVDVPVCKIAKSRSIAPEQVLLAWVKAKGAIVVTTSSKKDRLERYLDAGDLELTETEVSAIDAAGAAGSQELSEVSTIQTLTAIVLVAFLLWGTLHFGHLVGINVPLENWGQQVPCK